MNELIQNKQHLSLARKHMRQESRNYPAHCVLVPRSKWPAGSLSAQIAVWRSRDFLVQVFQEQGVIRMSVNRAELDSNGDWKAGISWDELQRIKRECGYGDREAVEIYPQDQDVVNVANIRHLWVLETPLPFSWKLRYT